MSDDAIARVLAAVPGARDAIREGIRRAAFLECAEIAEQRARELGEDAASMPERGPEWRNALSRADQLDTLAARYRQMAEGSGE